MNSDLCERLLREAREERICDGCGYERQHVRVWRQHYEPWCDGRVLAGPFARGTMQMVCFGCRPEFVVDPGYGGSHA